MHDITYDRLDTLGKSPLGILYEIGLIEPFSEITIKTESRFVRLIGVHYSEEIPKVTDMTSFNVCVAHMFYEYNLSKETLTKDSIIDYGYNMYVLGHDHVPYDTEVVDSINGRIRVVRPGSFMRGTSHSYNTNRQVFADVLSINGEISLRRDVIPSKASSDIFSAAVLDKVNNKDLIHDLAVKFSELVTKLYENTDSNTSVYSILDRTELDARVKDRIEMYLNQAGIFREKIN